MLVERRGMGREELELLLTSRGWGATLAASADASANPTGILMPGAITELVEGPGVTSLATQWAAQPRPDGAPRRLAWCDPQDRWDLTAAERAGVELERTLWLRGHSNIAGLAGLSRWNQVLLTLLASGSLELIVADFLDWPVGELRRIPRSAWFRLLRAAERWRRTALVVLAPEPITQSCAALVLGVRAETGTEMEADSRGTTARRETTPLEVRISAHVLRSRTAGAQARKLPQAEPAPRVWRLRA